MPRKYHRPPDTATKRRKSRKTPVPYEFEAAPAESAITEDELEEAGAAPVAVAEREPPAAADAAAQRGERHITVDYHYVRAEVVRIVAIMTFLIISLIITSIFR